MVSDRICVELNGVWTKFLYWNLGSDHPCTLGAFSIWSRTCTLDLLNVYNVYLWTEPFSAVHLIGTRPPPKSLELRRLLTRVERGAAWAGGNWHVAS